MAGKKGMKGNGLGGPREGAGRPRTRYIFRPGEMVTLAHYQPDGIGVDIYYCTTEYDQEKGVMRLITANGGWYEIGNLPDGAAE